jgi:hypothetical protein
MPPLSQCCGLAVWRSQGFECTIFPVADKDYFPSESFFFSRKIIYRKGLINAIEHVERINIRNELAEKGEKWY